MIVLLDLNLWLKQRMLADDSITLSTASQDTVTQPLPDNDHLVQLCRQRPRATAAQEEDCCLLGKATPKECRTQKRHGKALLSPFKLTFLDSNIHQRPAQPRQSSLPISKAMVQMTYTRVLKSRASSTSTPS